MSSETKKQNKNKNEIATGQNLVPKILKIVSSLSEQDRNMVVQHIAKQNTNTKMKKINMSQIVEEGIFEVHFGLTIQFQGDHGGSKRIEKVKVSERVHVVEQEPLLDIVNRLTKDYIKKNYDYFVVIGMKIDDVQLLPFTDFETLTFGM